MSICTVCTIACYFWFITVFVKFILRSKIPWFRTLPDTSRKYRFIWKIEERVLSGSGFSMFNREVSNREKFIEFKEEF